MRVVDDLLHVLKGLRRVDGDITDRVGRAVGHVDQILDGGVAHNQDIAAVVLDLRRADADGEDPAAEVVYHNDVAHVKQALADDEDTGDHVLHKACDAETEDKTEDAEARQQLRRVHAQRAEEQEHQHQHGDVLDEVAQQLDYCLAGALGQRAVLRHPGDEKAQDRAGAQRQDRKARDVDEAVGRFLLRKDVHAAEDLIVLRQEVFPKKQHREVRDHHQKHEHAAHLFARGLRLFFFFRSRIDALLLH